MKENNVADTKITRHRHLSDVAALSCSVRINSRKLTHITMHPQAFNNPRKYACQQTVSNPSDVQLAASMLLWYVFSANASAHAALTSIQTKTTQGIRRSSDGTRLNKQETAPIMPRLTPR